MKTFRASPRTAALAIILFFLLDRALSIGVFLPEFCVEDERWIREGAVRMVRDATVDPGTHKYPQLMIGLTAGVYGAAYLGANLTALPRFESLASFSWHRSHYQFAFAPTIVLGRLLSAAVGALALWLLWILARREFGEAAALAAMLFSAAAPALLFSTQLLKNDGLLTVGVLLAVLASLKVYERGKAVDYLAAGAAVGICLAAKYHAVALTPVLFAHRYKNSDKGILSAFARPAWLLAILAALMTFGALSPWTWLDLKGTIDQGAIEWAIQNRLNPLFRRSSELWWHKPVLFQFTSVLPVVLGLPLYALSLYGLIRKTELASPRRVIIFSYPAGFIAFMIAASELGAPHLYTQVAVFFALPAACACEGLMSAPGAARRLLGVALVGAVAGYNLVLFHSLTAAEERIIAGPAREMERTGRSGENDLAFVPYYPNPDISWSVRFAPQFLFTRDLLEKERPGRVLIHHAYYQAFLDNPELMENPNVRKTVIDYLELRAGKTGYRETDRWTGDIFTGSFYKILFPDFKGLRSSIYQREPPPQTGAGGRENKGG